MPLIMMGFMILILLALLRAVLGPTVIDRFIAINAITSKVSMIILLLAFYKKEYGFIDIAFVFMLCGFAGGLWIIKVLTPSVWEFKMPSLKELHGKGGGQVRDFIFKKIAAIIVPFICIYGFYVILHGSSSAGGSFAGGIILALGFIVFSTIYGLEKGKEKIPEKILVWVESYGTLWYGLIGLIGIIKGAPFLANKSAGINLGIPGSLASGGVIFFLGLGVGIRVASTMITLFFTMKGED